MFPYPTLGEAVPGGLGACPQVMGPLRGVFLGARPQTPWVRFAEVWVGVIKHLFRIRNSAKPTLGVWGRAPKKRVRYADFSWGQVWVGAIKHLFGIRDSAKPTLGVWGRAPQEAGPLCGVFLGGAPPDPFGPLRRVFIRFASVELLDGR
jgi:hypothetical protein